MAEPSGWQPTLGAWPGDGGTHFRVWAPTRQRLELVLETSGRAVEVYPLTKADDGTFSAHLAAVGVGDCYRYRLDGAGIYPDPASRFQPAGVHGPSQVVDASRFPWSDMQWRGVRLEELVIYELHVGTFSPAGTFAGITARLPHLRGLGVTAIELMPVADFAGQRNWGYDGVALFAPARCYGCPDDLRRLVNEAHSVGLGVILDVVYNHFGPDGAYAGTFSPYYFSQRHRTPWGAAINLDGAHSDMVRQFFIENALHWVHEYHVDGLRLDATHALIDDGPRHFLAELSTRVHASLQKGDAQSREVLLIAEDHRNLARMSRSVREGGWGLDAVWADDFHHQVRRGVAGDDEGYYRDFSGSTTDLAETIRRGWFYCGQHSGHMGRPRGTDPTGLAPRQFVICLQNHDQVGNRAFGERLHHQIDLATFRALSILLLCVPETPLLFMGQEWAASTPFLYFTDHDPELGKKVTTGRRREFKHFSAFADPRVRRRIPDPQALTTFLRSHLDWREIEEERHGGMLRLYQEVLQLRRTHVALRAAGWPSCRVRTAGDATLLLERSSAGVLSLLAVVHLRGAATVRASFGGGRRHKGIRWRPLLDTESRRFSPDPQPIRIDPPHLGFSRPGAIILPIETGR